MKQYSRLIIYAILTGLETGLDFYVCACVTGIMKYAGRMD